jgi:hypothetical protein
MLRGQGLGRPVKHGALHAVVVGQEDSHAAGFRKFRLSVSKCRIVFFRMFSGAFFQVFFPAKTVSERYLRSPVFSTKNAIFRRFPAAFF